MTEQAEKKKSFKDTLNLPKTAFNMKANLVQNEPATLKRWQQAKLYDQVRAACAGRPRYVFHDGPPYANGSIHLGHLLNKVLKDLVVRTRTMAGFDVPYIPGWDCHGLPIEHKVMQELGEKARGMVPVQIRKRCSDYAEKYIKLQRGQMERLLTLADYDHPYLTMAKEFEAATMEVFGDLVGKGLVYRALKPVHWSIANQTALAEAELEYEDREDTSVYVMFEVAPESRAGMLDEFVGEDSPLRESDEKVYVMIWTTTPWTLPANLAVAVHASYRYALTRIGGKLVVLADELANKVATGGGGNIAETLGTTEGFNLVGMRYLHPFVERHEGTEARGHEGKNPKPDSVFTIVAADYVTLEDGTGMVHTAPGHGVEDYQTGLREKLPIYCPVQADGTFDDTAPDWLRGKTVWDANKLVVDRLRGSGHLFRAHQFMHSYPHDWRSKTPVIFRATEQWFVGVEKPFRTSNDPDELLPTSLRDRALNEIGFDSKNPQTRLQKETTAAIRAISGVSPEDGKKIYNEVQKALKPEQLAQDRRETASAAGLLGREPVHFVPEWGRNRMRGMLESRPDWCLSRQRSWGLPIPAFFGEKPGEVLLTKASIQAVADVVRAQGSDAWFKLESRELLAKYDVESDPDAPQWIKSQISDLKFEIKKGPDIFDVWFESGSSWNAVIVQRGLAHDPRKQPVTDLYLEGSDQHRGWFQCSLLPALGVTGRSPFATVLTHGFMVDMYGRKMSKTPLSEIIAAQVARNVDANEAISKKIKADDLLKKLGWSRGVSAGDQALKKEDVLNAYQNDAELKTLITGEQLTKLLSNAIDVDDLVPKYGADVCRWWVCSLNTDNDIKVDWSYFNVAGDEYRKVRNTIKFLLSNLYDYQKSQHAHAWTAADATSIDAWAMSELNKLTAEVRDAYDKFEFRRASEAIFNFCNETMSAVYLAATKDRLYCDKPDSTRRRRTQTAMYEITHALIRMFAPILPHTADEAWASLHQRDVKDCPPVHAELLPVANTVAVDSAWEVVMTQRDGWHKVIEESRQKMGIDNPLDCGLEVPAAPELAKVSPGDLADLCGISQLKLVDGGALKVVDLRNELVCERSWKRDGTVKVRGDGSKLSDRDAAAVGV